MALEPTETRSDPAAARSDSARLAGELYEMHRTEIQGFARNLVGAAHDSEIDEVIQNALLAFVQSYRGDADDRAGGWAYLKVALKTAMYKRARRHERKGAVTELSERPTPTTRSAAAARSLSSELGDPESAVIAREALDARREEIHLLAAQERSCVGLAACGYSTEEIAAALELSERQVRKRIEKANRRLRETGEEGA